MPPTLRSMLKKIRKALAGKLLHGGLRDAWLARLNRRLAAEYSEFILRRRAPTSVPKIKFPHVGGLKLERMLFVCDNMWERRELLPELQKIADVAFLDVRPFRQGGPATAEESLDWATLRSKVEELGDKTFDLVLVYLHASLISGDLLKMLRRKSRGAFVGMNLDDKTTYTEYTVYRGNAMGYRHWASAFDCNLSNSRNLVDIYRDDGFSCLYLPTGFHYNPAIHRFDPPSTFEWEISFVGSCKPERKILIDELSARGIEVKVFGGGWPGAQFSNEGSAIYRKTAINLGIGYNIPGKQITNLKNRDFECPGSGGCYLTTYDWELAGFFHVGKEILCYRDVDDLVEIFSFFRRRPEKCIEIAQAGFARCVREHTWAHRFKTVFEELGFVTAIKSKLS